MYWQMIDDWYIKLVWCWLVDDHNDDDNDGDDEPMVDEWLWTNYSR